MTAQETNEKIQVLGVPLQGLNFVTVCIVAFLAKGSLDTQEANQNQLQETTMEMRDDLRALKIEIDSLHVKAAETEKIGGQLGQIEDNHRNLSAKMEAVVTCLREPRKRCTI